MDLSFLSDLNLEAPEKEKRSRTTMQVAIAGDFRIFRSGGIEFTEEFRTKVDNKWLDIVFSSKWKEYPQDRQKLCFININTIDKPAKADIKTESKSVVYIKDTFLVESEELWGIKWENTAFVDFKLEDTSIEVKIAALPKVIQRGESKGDPDYVRRENITLTPITPLNLEPKAVQTEIPFEDGQKESEGDPIDDDIRNGM